MKMMFRILLLVVTCMSSVFIPVSAKGFEKPGKTVYFMSPVGYDFQDDKVLLMPEEIEDDFSGVIESLRNRIVKSGYKFEATTLDDKLSDFAYLISCNISENNVRRLTKYPKDRLIFFDLELPDSDAPSYDQFYKYFGKVFTTKDNLVDDEKFFKYNDFDIDDLFNNLGLVVQKAKKAPKISVSLDEEEEFVDESDRSKEISEDRDSLDNGITLSIEGKQVYNNGQIIQLKGHPEGLNYLWTGPSGFSSTARAISLFAREGSRGLYTLEAKLGDVTKSVSAEIVVLGKDPLLVQGPVVVKEPVVVKKEEIVPPVAKSLGCLLVKTHNIKLKNDEVSFTVYVANVGKEQAKNVIVNDFVPECLSIINAQGDKWEIKALDKEVQARLDVLEVFESKTLNITARILRQPDYKVRNRVTVKSDATVFQEAVAQLL